jgi:hypothetical protein
VIKVSAMNIMIGAENLILLTAHKIRDRPPVIPRATSLGIKMKIFMVEICKSFMRACIDSCAFCVCVCVCVCVRARAHVFV